jgi:iron complex outermembrane receptor protein
VSQDATEENGSVFGLTVYDTPGGIGPTGPAPNGPATTEKDYTRQISEELRFTSTGTGPVPVDPRLLLSGPVFRMGRVVHCTAGASGDNGRPQLYVDYQPQTIVQNSEFGEASWQFTPDFKATVGLRHYRYTLGQTNLEYGTFTVNSALGNTVPYNTAASSSASGTDPKFDLSYNLDKDILLYATVAKGFRLGGANQPIPVANCGNSNGALVANETGLQAKLLLNTACNPAVLLQAPATFSSDSVWNYEIGEKSAFLDHRLIANVSAYYERWTNPQVATNVAGFGLSVNGGTARIYGVEAQLQALLTREWNLDVNFGYTNAQFIEASAITGYPSGTDVPDIPKVTAAGTLRWKHPISNNLALTAAIEADYVGTRTDTPYGETVTLDNVNDIVVHLPSYAIANFRVGMAGEAWSANLFVNNFTNKEALLDPEPQIVLQIPAYVRYLVNRPLTAGIDVSYKFH